MMMMRVYGSRQPFFTGVARRAFATNQSQLIKSEVPLDIAKVAEQKAPRYE